MKPDELNIDNLSDPVKLDGALIALYNSLQASPIQMFNSLQAVRNGTQTLESVKEYLEEQKAERKQLARDKAAKWYADHGIKK